MIHRLAVSGQHLTVLNGDALGAKQQLGGAHLLRVGAVVQHMAQYGLHQQVDEHRGGVDGGLGKEAAVVALQRAVGEQPVAKV